MQPFSIKEYELLKKETTEIRNCITNYIGYIITVIGFAGFSRYIIGNNDKPTLVLFIITITMIIITLLFEIIYYKFKSHNRFVGFIQLLMQEQGIIRITDKIKNDKEKEYIIKYKDLILKKNKYEEFENLQCYSWEFVMGRYNNNTFRRNSTKPLDILKNTLSATSKSKFVFSIPNQYYNEIRINDYDKHFFKKIIWKLYGLKKQERNLFKRIGSILFSLKYLFSKEKKNLIKNIFIDKIYVVSGWVYPKKITQIGFISILLFFLYFIFELGSNFNIISLSEIKFEQISIENIFPIVLFAFVIIILFTWIMRYVHNLKELIYGKYSIDYYCWNFFIFRTHFLNENEIIPVYYSRSFIRFFKTILITRFIVEYNKTIEYERLIENLYNCRTKDNLYYFLEKNRIEITKSMDTILSNPKTLKENSLEYDFIRDEIIKGFIINSNLIKSEIINVNTITTDSLISYADKLLKFEEFNDYERINIHNIIVAKYKKEKML